MAKSLFDRVAGWFWPKKVADATPGTEPAPTPARQPTLVDYVKAWQLLKEIPFHKLGRVVSLSGLIVFFAISGVFAWLSWIAKFVLGTAR